MSELNLLHESTVDQSEIDSLGHMNVRYYVSRVAKANRVLLKNAGINADAMQGRALRRTDTYTRFLREQFAGARLHTLGGLIAGEGVAASQGFSAYFEIVNPDSDELAATFIVTSNIIDGTTQEVVHIPLPPEPARSELVVHIPRHGMPRSLSLAPPRIVALQTLEGLVSDEPTPGLMSGRREGEVLPEDCDSSGRLREDVDLMFIVHRPQPGQEAPTVGPPVMQSADGFRYSWAMMETRAVVWRRPNAGDTVVSLGAEIAHAEKWRHSRRWTFAKDSGLLLGVSDILGLCIDLDARRAISIPADVRETIERNSVPQLA